MSKDVRYVVPLAVPNDLMVHEGDGYTVQLRQLFKHKDGTLLATALSATMTPVEAGQLAMALHEVARDVGYRRAIYEEKERRKVAKRGDQLQQDQRRDAGGSDGAAEVVVDGDVGRTRGDPRVSRRAAARPRRTSSTRRRARARPSRAV